jgi:hypothetical protein
VFSPKKAWSRGEDHDRDAELSVTKGGQDDDLGHCVKNLDQEPRKKALKTDNLKKRIYAQPLGRNQAEVFYRKQKNCWSK